MTRLPLAWRPEYAGVVAALATFTGGYCAYWFLGHSAALRTHCDRRYPGERSQTMLIFWQRALGAVFLSVPALTVAFLMPESGFVRSGLSATDPAVTLCWIAGMWAVAVPLVVGFSRTPRFYAVYPLIRQRVWSRPLVAVNALSWCAYILVYEFLFRGFLLGTFVRAFGAWPGILVNVALYACVHIPYGFWVTLGALPLGFAVCVATVHTGGIWAAYAAHLLVALLNDYVALAANPGMRVGSG
jgi:membrane protease YdiL (CAAX protease family)